MNVAPTAVVDGRLYVDVDALVEHLTVARETVEALCAEASPLGTRIVCETLGTTIETLRGLA